MIQIFFAYACMYSALFLHVAASGSSIPSPQQSVNLDPSSSRPQYPRTQYSISRAHVILDQTGIHSL